MAECQSKFQIRLFVSKNNIDRGKSVWYYCSCELSLAVVAQSVVRRIGSAEVTGSIPVSSLKEKSSRKPLKSRVFCSFGLVGNKLNSKCFYWICYLFVTVKAVYKKHTFNVLIKC